MNQNQRDEFVRLLGEGDLAHSDIILAVDRLRARVAVLDKELDSWPLHGEGRLTKGGWELAQSRYAHVCETVEEFRGYWTELQDSKARVAELEKVHAAAGKHLAANGPCDLRDESDEADDYEGGNCGESDCTYCALDRIASSVAENTDQSGEGGS